MIRKLKFKKLQVERKGNMYFIFLCLIMHNNYVWLKKIVKIKLSCLKEFAEIKMCLPIRQKEI